MIRVDGRRMVLSHYYTLHVSEEVQLSVEYSEAKWVSLRDLDSFEPKVETIPAVVRELSKLERIILRKDMVLM